MATLVGAWILVGELSGSAIVPQRINDLFASCEIRAAVSGFESDLFRYRLFVPSDMEANEKYPLLVWLHGYGENGRDNISQLKWLELVFQRPREINRYKFFLLAAQCPREEPFWTGRMPTVLDKMIEKTRNDFPIDSDRIYLAGVSSGATGCWEIAMRYPDTFSALLPMGSSDVDASRLARIRSVPVWTFYSLDDPADGLSHLRAVVNAFQEMGGHACLSETGGMGHDCWTAAFRDEEALEWLLQQSHGRVSRKPGSHSWYWHARQWTAEQLVLEIAIIGVLLWAIASVARKCWRRVGDVDTNDRPRM